MAKTILEPFEQSLASLNDIFVTSTSSVVLRDAIILRFQYTLENVYKYFFRTLEGQGIENLSPENIFNEFKQQNFIDDPGIWMNFVAAKNLIIQSYNDANANEVFKIIPQFVESAEELLTKIKKNGI